MRRAPTDSRAACLDFRQAWQYYWFARWPVCNSDGKRKAFEKGIDAFAQHARLLEPALELVRIPFEGVEIKQFGAVDGLDWHGAVSNHRHLSGAIRGAVVDHDNFGAAIQRTKLGQQTCDALLFILRGYDY